MMTEKQIRKPPCEPVSSARNYSAKTLKILWGRSAGRCAVPECRAELIVDATSYDPIVVIGDIAHIAASSDIGPRSNAALTAKERDSYDNLILLCKNCHARFDGQKVTNTVEAIKKLRAEHEAWVRASLPERGRSATPWRVLLVQGDYPIDATHAETALSPDHPKGPPTVLTAPSSQPWGKLYKSIEKTVRRFLSKGDSFESRFAVFPLAPVSVCILVGYLLTNRPRVRLFQHHRTRGQWSWPKDKRGSGDFVISGMPKKSTLKKGEVAICFNLSARIRSAQLPIDKKLLLGLIDIAVSEPSVHWLQSSDQLEKLGAAVANLFGAIQSYYPEASRWHLFFAGPAPAAIKVGQQLNPTMTPLVQLYEFRQAGGSAYTASLLLGEHCK
ncbi:hypothetical protein SAMN02745166_01190 [Prosthecobacter debontii]|uniref:Uncharacterized protein n=1 Tax=Prosthecobacter debontii TaxID=48467 RepID=A0A1T4X9C8_9BACT|nr:SAVED domain-containing protein [Prosthecobacter debontii]SKA85705.1 hypothetical protein SAMN02745166_01190 [Prosthecobacter debontii]